MKSQWEQPGIVRRYTNRRHQPFELVQAERHFFPGVLDGMRTMLDVGCASGGMFNIVQQMGSEIRYTGVDFSEPSIRTAQELYGWSASFLMADAHSLPFSDQSFSFVHARGLLCHIPDWQAPLNEMLRVMRKRLLVDMRFSEEPSKSLYVIATDAEPVDFYTISQDIFYNEIPKHTTVKRFDRAGVYHRGVKKYLTEATMLIER